jgi:DNA-binding GntR family transcriptional regulator
MSINNLAVRPLLKITAESQAADALREAIVTGGISPGARLTEIDLATRLRISRATLRVALHQLTKEGLVTQVPYTGWKVVSLTSHDAWELYTMRSAIERLAGRLVAGRLAGPVHQPEAASTLRSTFDRLVAACMASDRNAVAEADFEFHKRIIELAEHRRLAQQYGLIEQQIRIFIRSSDSLVDNPVQIIDQHRPILEALIAGDVEAAGQTSEIHNLVEGEKLSTFLKRHEGGCADQAGLRE